MLPEFNLIERWFVREAEAGRGVQLGIGDDCALLRVPAGQQLAISCDTLVAGTHFLADDNPEALGHKALAVGLSDLAAMGAEPVWATLALTLPTPDEAWLDGFSRGLFELAEQHGVALIGGDTTRGPLSITMQLHGWVPDGAALTRAGARPGDGIWVSGEPGEAALALQQRLHGRKLHAEHAEALFQRLDRPTPRVAAGIALRGIASAAIDVSDGLAADIGHILARSGLGAELRLDALPLSAALMDHLSPQAAADFVLSGGDDYELCVTIPAAHEQKMVALAAQLKLTFTRIGTMVQTSGLRCVDGAGVHHPLPSGFRHF